MTEEEILNADYTSTAPEEDDDLGYRVFAVNVTWDMKHEIGHPLKRKQGRLPSELTIDIPDGVLKQAKSESQLRDIIETFVYNTMSRKHGYEIVHAQIWLPLDK